MNDALVVVKVGGSLYDLPDLGDRLRRWLGPYPTTLLFPGGGPTADVIRDFDHTHRLGEEASHWLAIRALSLNAHFLARLLPEATLVTRPVDVPVPGWSILDPYPFFRADEANPDHLPHCWDVTSDSLAVRVAVVLAAREAFLLKSVSGNKTWAEAIAAGEIDPYLTRTWHQAPGALLRVRTVNLRAWPP